ncbi:MAG: hypothetical protein RLZZ502_1116 [Pseudomonadota bacterium]|jgi:predicted aspartyl protease
MPYLLILLVLLCGVAEATVVKLLSINKNKGEALFSIDSRATRLALHQYSEQGVYLQKLSADEATVRFRGVEEVLSPGRLVVVAQNLLGQHSIAMMADAEGKYSNSFVILNQPLNAWVDVKTPGVIIPAAEAERIRLPYREDPNANPSMVGAAKPDPNTPKLKFLKPIKFTKGKKIITHYPVDLRLVKLGQIEVFGVRAIITDDESVTKATFGKSFIMKLDPEWMGSTMTLTRRN